jgi:outer membrane protein OmpA-like peptidoglycan-associated protein
LGIAILIAWATAFSQDVKTALFKDATDALKAAKKVQADVLAPKNFGEAMKYYQEADGDFKKGKNLEDIRKKLNASIVYFRKSTEATKLAEVTFTSSTKARSDAKNAEAPKFSSKLWSDAEAKFAEAAGKLEDGDVNSAKKKAGEAETIYRQAELDAIKVNYLNETWELLKQADQLKVKDRAPKTLQRAQHLIKEAEKELNTNRYDTDVARSLAQQAKYEARHAIYLANTIKEMKDKKQSLEDMMLAAEMPLQQIAEKMDLVASFETGFGKTTGETIQYVSTYQDSAAKLSQDLAERDQQIGTLGGRIAEMDKQVADMQKKLGIKEQEKSALAKQIEEQARIRELFASMEQSFTREEARVMREGNDIIIRLVGLNFPVAKSTIEPQYFGLLTKVLAAMNKFPQSTVSIQGHTDSHGSDEKNLQLSIARAEAVKQYILANSNFDASRIEAIGYGESKPIATNETADGRAKNRRIEVVIHPQTGGTF